MILNCGCVLKTTNGLSQVELAKRCEHHGGEEKRVIDIFKCLHVEAQLAAVTKERDKYRTLYECAAMENGNLLREHIAGDQIPAQAERFETERDKINEQIDHISEWRTLMNIFNMKGWTDPLDGDVHLVLRRKGLVSAQDICDAVEVSARAYFSAKKGDGDE